MDYPNSTHLVAFCSIILIWQIYKKKDLIIHYIIATLVYPIKNRQGRPISGPQWTFIDGQGIEKFLRGHEVSRDWRQYGPVYRIWSGFDPEIVLTRPEDIKAFHSDSSVHAKSTSSNGGWLFHQLLGDCMGLINGKRWERVRAAFSPYFVHHTIANISPQLQDAAAKYIQGLRALDSTDGKVQVHAANTSRFPFMTTAEYLYGPLTDSEKASLWSLGQRSLSLMGTVLSGGVYRSKCYPVFRPQTHRLLKQFEHDWTAFNEQIYHSRNTHHPQPPVVRIWESLVDEDGPPKELIQTMSEMLFANLDVATHVLGWLVIFIAQNTKIQQQLREEIRSSSNLALYVARRDSLLHLCFLESLRLRPFTVFSIPESSPQAKVLGGFIIPPTTSVVVDTLSINHNKDFWGDDSLNFNPHRLKKLSPTELRYNLFTFGFGTRKCLGQYFGEAMVKQFLCVILDGYEMQLSNDEAQKGLYEKSSKDTWVPISDLRVTLTPKK